MHVIFRTDASLKIGTGHVMRCITLAKALKENSVNVEFICRKHDGNLVNRIRSNGFSVYELDLLEGNVLDKKLSHSHWLGVTQQQDVDDCINILKSKKTNWIIIDHYALDEDWQNKLKPFCDKIMVIDDLADRKHQCDILLDQTFARQQEDYLILTPKNCQLLLGSQYALLRPEFSEWREFSLERRSKPEFKQLFINIGGVDVNNVTENILDRLELCNLSNDMSITVVMGGSAPYLESVKSKSITLPYKTEVKVDVGNMAELMANADIAIGASGATTWERCCLGLPTIQIIIAKNQITIAKSLSGLGAIKFLQSIKGVSRVIKNPRNWMLNVSNIARHVSDGLGVKRVSSVLMNKKL